MFWLRNNFQLHTLIWGPGLCHFAMNIFHVGSLEGFHGDPNQKDLILCILREIIKQAINNVPHYYICICSLYRLPAEYKKQERGQRSGIDSIKHHT